MDKEKFYAPMGGRSTAASKRSAQLKNWESSATNKESKTIKPSRLRPNVQFGDTVVFLAAAMSGDVEDVERLVAEGADVNAVNSDGLTGLHQVCYILYYYIVALYVVIWYVCTMCVCAVSSGRVGMFLHTIYTFSLVQLPVPVVIILTVNVHQSDCYQHGFVFNKPSLCWLSYRLTLPNLAIE